MTETQSFLGFADPISSWTHLAGAVVFLVLAGHLWRRHGDTPSRLAAVLVFGASSVFLLAMSGVYHLLEEGGLARAVLRRLDHGGIFVLIAGSITAVHLVLFTGRWRWVMIAVAWILCTQGVVFKTVFFSEVPEWAGLGLYLLMGWLGLITTLRLWWLRGGRFVRLLLAGGVVYTVGAVVDFVGMPVLLPRWIGPHELFHVLVLVALGLHWGFVGQALATTSDAERVCPDA